MKTNTINNNILPVIKYAEYAYNFWDSINNKLVINQVKYTDFLKHHGYLRLQLDKNDLENFLLVQIKSNVVFKVGILNIHDFTKNYIETENLDAFIDENHTVLDLLNLFLNKAKYLLTEKCLYKLDLKYIDFHNDNQNESYVYFENCFVKVNKDDILTYDYHELTKPVWSTDIIPFKFNLITENFDENIKLFTFFKFLRNICTDKESNSFDNERYLSLISAIGYLLHRYNSPKNLFAILLTEANVSEEPAGRSGKGLLMQAVSKIRKMSKIDGQNFDFKSNFLWEELSIDVKIAFVDDLVRYFPFNNMFSVITDGITLKQKYKNPVVLGIEQSPKWVLSTNFQISNSSESAKSRLREIELLPYYNADFTPIDDFKEVFFHDWNTEKWNIFYNFMLRTIQFYLHNNKEVIKFSSETMKYKKIIQTGGLEFLEFCKNTIQIGIFDYNYLYKKCIEYTDLTEKSMSKKRFSSMIKLYCDLNNLFIEKRRVSRAKTMYYFITNNHIEYEIEGMEIHTIVKTYNLYLYDQDSEENSQDLF